jgi:SAM-dependent methyltransferase
MYDWVKELQSGDRLLDLCSGPGSLPPGVVPCLSVAVDEDTAAFHNAFAITPGVTRCFAQSHHLPFATASFDLVICSHALEHVVELDATLAEIARVLKPTGRLFVSVPNGYGVCDSVYRFLFEGGGHVNRFRREPLVERIERTAQVHLAKWTRLYSSFVYLRRIPEVPSPRPADFSPRLALFCRLPRKLHTVAQRLLYSGTRMVDRAFGTNTALYGWAFWFDRSSGPAVEQPAYVNVCRVCGDGSPAATLERPTPGVFRCPNCQNGTPFFKPFGNAE